MTEASREDIPAIPDEFLPENVAALSGDDAQLTDARWFANGEPFRSMHKNNPWLRPPVGGNGVPAMRPDGSLTERFQCPLYDAGRSDEGGGLNGTPYYDTTVARKHNYWKQFNDLPRETKDINRARQDLKKYGFCLIEDAMSEKQCSYMRDRLEEQAEAERECGLADMSPHFHIMWTLVNKGDCFAKCIEFNPEWVQGGPLIEQLNDELLGPNHYSYSFASNIARPGSYPQNLHQDSGAIHPIQTPHAPVLVNTVYIMQDVNEVNGGTLVIPTSHRLVSQTPAGQEVGPLPPAINVEAKGGTVMLMDGRLLHGTGVNHTDDWRYIMTNSNVKPWMRQQENWQLSVDPEVLSNASDKLLRRMGYFSSGLLEIGTYSGPKTTVAVRLAMDKGEYHRIRAMKSPVPDTVKEQLTIYRMKQQIDPAREAARAKRAAEEAAASAGTIQD
ncbi:MAG: phytanoyl-CoA dioxygenase family protein [Proteobacteria bacterium]|nr:phytanoyl-CoA dioxygenase family protein [Pseudomonadota bacterium]MDA1298577.1 phytanoyl-CoA dioxygenase family protein [Pseudomonadota bacterium]